MSSESPSTGSQVAQATPPTCKGVNPVSGPHNPAAGPHLLLKNAGSAGVPGSGMGAAQHPGACASAPVPRPWQGAGCVRAHLQLF